MSWRIERHKTIIKIYPASSSHLQPKKDRKSEREAKGGREEVGDGGGGFSTISAATNSAAQPATSAAAKVRGDKKRELRKRRLEEEGESERGCAPGGTRVLLFIFSCVYIIHGLLVVVRMKFTPRPLCVDNVWSRRCGPGMIRLSNVRFPNADVNIGTFLDSRTRVTRSKCEKSGKVSIKNLKKNIWESGYELIQMFV